MFKRFFKGRSKDKSNVYEYHDCEENESSKVYECKYEDEIVNHFREVFPGKEVYSFRDIVSDIVKIDVHFMFPTEDSPFYVVFTTGMSSLCMTPPEEWTQQEKDEYGYGEIMMMLPASWKVGQEEFKDMENFWPIRLMKILARFPHQYHTYLGYGHTIPNYDDYEPYDDSTELNAVLLLWLKDEISKVKVSDGKTVNVYIAVPAYKEEIEYKLENGLDKLLEKYDELDQPIIMLDPDRENVCK